MSTPGFLGIGFVDEGELVFASGFVEPVLSVQNQDYTMTQALVMLVVTIAVLSNLVVDLLYAWLDPRIRLA